LRVLLLDDMLYNYAKIIPLEVFDSLEQLKVFRFGYLHFSKGNNSTVEEEISLLEKLESLPKLEELCVDLKNFASMQRLFQIQSTKLRDCSRCLRICILISSFVTKITYNKRLYMKEFML